MTATRKARAGQPHPHAARSLVFPSVRQGPQCEGRTRTPQGPGCGWPDRAQTGAPPTPPLSLGSDQHAGARDARRPHRRPVPDDRRAQPASNALPVCRQALHHGGDRPLRRDPVAGRTDPEAYDCRRRRARGAPCKRDRALRSASQDARDRARPQPRSVSPGALRGVPARRGRRRRLVGSGAGEDFPPSGSAGAFAWSICRAATPGNRRQRTIRRNYIAIGISILTVRS